MELINFIFMGVIAGVMFLCMFSLFSLMTVNIYLQGKEIGILRALGVGRFLMFRIFLYEAFILVLSSCMIGYIIGNVLSNIIASHSFVGV